MGNTTYKNEFRHKYKKEKIYKKDKSDKNNWKYRIFVQKPESKDTVNEYYQ